MNCPICIVPLVVTERQNVEIDYCPQCRGVWLDRGELDKIIDRASSFAPNPDQKRSKDSRHYEERDDRDYSDKFKKKKREGFLGELFDF